MINTENENRRFTVWNHLRKLNVISLPNTQPKYNDWKIRKFGTNDEISRDYFNDILKPNDLSLTDWTDDEFFKGFVCDIRPDSEYCQATAKPSDEVKPETPTSQQTEGWPDCVTKNTKVTFSQDGTTVSFTSSDSNYGVVTLTKDNKFTSTGPKYTKGTWSCTQSGKIFITYKDSESPTPSPVTPPTTSPTTSKPTWTEVTYTEDDVKNGKFVKRGMKGDIVKKIQEYLKKHGFTSYSKSGKTDGLFGGRTYKTVINFQKQKGLVPDGIVGPKTIAELIKPKSEPTKETNVNIGGSDLKYSGGLKDEVVNQAKEYGDLQQTEQDLFWKDDETRKKYTENQNNIQNEDYMKTLKNIIKNKLNETLEKNKKTITETKIIDKRFNILLEGKTFKTEKEKNELMISIVSEILYLNSQNYSQELISEGLGGLFSTLKSLFTDKGFEGIGQTLKEKFAGWIADKLGIESNSYFYNLIISVVGNTPITELPKLLTDCNFLVGKITKALPEAIIRKTQYDKGLGGAIGDVIRNSLYDLIEDSDFSNKISNGLSTIICPLLGKLKENLGGVFSGMRQRALTP